MTTWDGGEYQSRFDALAASGADMHGEADLVASLVAPGASVLDAGCGTGRVAIELARRGHPVVGTDLDASMLAVARERAPDVEWVQSDLAALDLGRTFEVVVMAGNVLLFTAPGTEVAVVAGCARHVAPGGLLVAGFQLGQRTTPTARPSAATTSTTTTRPAPPPASPSSIAGRPGTRAPGPPSAPTPSPCTRSRGNSRSDTAAIASSS